MADDAASWSMSEDPREAERNRYHIGEFAERVQLSHRTIRHYDDLGIVKPTGRTAGGFRVYTDQDVRRFLLIKPFKPLDVSLADAKAVVDALDAIENPDATRDQLQAAHNTLTRVLARMAEERAEKLTAIRMSEDTVHALSILISSPPTDHELR